MQPAGCFESRSSLIINNTNITHDGPAPALALSAGQAAPRVPGAGGARGVGETHNLEKAGKRANEINHL